MESLIRNRDGKAVTDSDILALAAWNAASPVDREIPFKVGRVLMQDLTGVPAIVDLAAMRDAVVSMKLDPKIIEPEVPTDLIIDHSIQVDSFRNQMAFQINAELEIERNRERYEFLKWAQQAFHKMKLVPPDTGICHQVNLEFLATVVMLKESEGRATAYPDTLVGTDSHTPMINGLGILGWGVGGIEAEAALLGQPVTFVTPRVIGVHLAGQLADGVTATDVVLTITQKLRAIGVVDAFVEFFGEGVKSLPVAARATISNMTPEFGATASLFPVDDETLRYLRLTGRPESHIDIVKKYFENQEMYGVPRAGQIDYTQVVDIDLSKIEPSVAGPALPHDRVGLKDVSKHLIDAFPDLKQSIASKLPQKIELGDGKEYTLSEGDVVIAAITSCTNTSNPEVMIAAGLLAKKAVELGLDVRDVVKTSMAPGSMVVTEYLKAMGLLPYLEKLGFGIVGYGCTTCVAQGTPVLLANGTTREIENLTEDGTLLFGPTEKGRLQIDRQSGFIKQGVRDCVRLVLQDGRSVICTPDHKILTSDGRWVRADALELGRDRVVVGLDAPLDKRQEDEVGHVFRAGALTFRMEIPSERSRALAFCRLLGHLLSDGSISVWGQGRMNVGQAVDREMVLNDIELITGLRPSANRYDARKWSIVLPTTLTKAITSLPGVQVGVRIRQIPALPAFVLDPSCPVSLVREFLGGLFGADGHAPMLHRYGKREEDATLEPPAFSQSTVASYAEQSVQMMRVLTRLLKRCGVNIEGARVYKYSARRGHFTYAPPIDGMPRIQVVLALADGLSFVENVGFRYCVDKMMRATAAAVYWRLIDNIHVQRLWMAEQLRLLHQEQPMLSFSKARQLVAAEMLSKEGESLAPVTSPHYALLEGYDRFSRLPSINDRKFQPLHRVECDFPSPVELFRQLGVRHWFSSLKSREETEKFRRYCVEKEAGTLPTFSLQVVDRRQAGQRLVYDLSVNDLHAFIAGTIAVHNCIGNSGPLQEPVAKAIRENSLTTAAVLSGNRNFEARIHQDVRANFLMSPPLVVAYALAGTVLKDLTTEPLATDRDGQPVYLRDIWPSQRQVHEYLTSISTEMFRSKYAQVYDQNSEWNKLDAPTGLKYIWDENSTYIQKPPYFDDYPARLQRGEEDIQDILGARPLLILGDYVTTDHISPAGAISPKSAAGKYLISKRVTEENFNSYGSRRGNHLVMIRGTFANPRIKNMIVGGVEGSITKHFPDGETMLIYDAAMKYQSERVPLLVIAGKGFGTGSSRDWAAKGQKLLGVRAVIAESFERIHRSNLIGMGVLPLQFDQGTGAKSLMLDGTETFTVMGLQNASERNSRAKLVITRTNGEKVQCPLRVRLDSQMEREYYRSGGILDYVLQKTVNARA